MKFQQLKLRARFSFPRFPKATKLFPNQIFHRISKIFKRIKNSNFKNDRI